MTPDPHSLVLLHCPRARDSSGKLLPFTYDPAKVYAPGHRGDKPDGLWVSVLGEDDWYSWCSSEEFNVETLHRPHSVALTADANILVLDTADKIRAFAARYEDTSQPLNGPHWDRYRHYIDWPRLATEYDGIIIAPYQWSVRNSWTEKPDGQTDEMWYYGWDCASGAIWNLSAVLGVTALPEDTPHPTAKESWLQDDAHWDVSIGSPE